MTPEPVLSFILRSRSFLVAEFLVLFFLIPAVLYSFGPLPVLPFLWLVASWCAWVLLKDPEFDRVCLWRCSALSRGKIDILIQSVFCGASLFLFVYLLDSRLLFSLVREQPVLWLMIVVLYPLLSVYPQELVYRAYFFHRYRPLFRKKGGLIFVNILLFGYMHIVFYNWIAVLLTLVGGAFFAVMYDRFRSILLVSLEHALFGYLIFTIGLGHYFYSGTISMLSGGSGG